MRNKKGEKIMKYKVEVGSFCTRFVKRNVYVNAKNEEEAAEKAIDRFIDLEMQSDSSNDPGTPQVDSIQEVYKGEEMQRVLDATAGSRMIWFDKQNKDVLYMDNRQLRTTLCDGRTLNINPDIIADFREIPFEDDTFYLVVFDPPHLLKAGENSWLAKKYGVLSDNWQEDIKQGFEECMRVLKPNGTLVFKWNEEQVKLREVIKAIGYKPLFGNRRSKTHWLVFMKD